MLSYHWSLPVLVVRLLCLGRYYWGKDALWGQSRRGEEGRGREESQRKDKTGEEERKGEGMSGWMREDESRSHESLLWTTQPSSNQSHPSLWVITCCQTRSEYPPRALIEHMCSVWTVCYQLKHTFHSVYRSQPNHYLEICGMTRCCLWTRLIPITLHILTNAGSKVQHPCL